MHSRALCGKVKIHMNNWQGAILIVCSLTHSDISFADLDRYNDLPGRPTCCYYCIVASSSYILYYKVERRNSLH